MLPVEVKVLPTSKRLKQLIKEHDDVWVAIEDEPRPMQCFDNELGVSIMSQDGTHQRNVRLTDLDL